MYKDLYDMTLTELIKTLENKNKGLGYELWKQASIIAGFFSKKIPESPEEASPELFPPKKTYRLPPELVEKYFVKRGGR